MVQTLAEAGQVVAAGQTVVKLAHAGPRETAAYLPETLDTMQHDALEGEHRKGPARVAVDTTG